MEFITHHQVTVDTPFEPSNVILKPKETLRRSTAVEERLGETAWANMSTVVPNKEEM